jgi:hypothetical protein
MLKRSGKLRERGRDASSGTKAMGKGAGQGPSLDTDEHEQPGRCARLSGQVASSNMRRRRWAPTSAAPGAHMLQKAVAAVKHSTMWRIDAVLVSPNHPCMALVASAFCCSTTKTAHTVLSLSGKWVLRVANRCT